MLDYKMKNMIKYTFGLPGLFAFSVGLILITFSTLFLIVPIFEREIPFAFLGLLKPLWEPF